MDSSLLAVLLAEIETGGEEKPLSSEMPQVNGLRNMLRELASHAEEVQLSEFAELNSISPTEGTISSQDLTLSGTTTDTSVSSASSRFSVQSFSTPLGFLQASLPDIPVDILKQALKDVEESGRELDMWNLVGNILSQEYIRESEERGLSALVDSNDVVREEDIQWEIVSRKSKKHHRSATSDKRKHAQATKITLVDIRQQNHGNRQHRKSDSFPKPPLPDLWTQVQSIATNISAYLNPHPPSFFLSYLHSPQYRSPYQALCAALESICKVLPNVEESTTLLQNILEIILPEYEPLDSEQRSRLVHETELCIRATSGRGDDVIDLVRLFRELSLDASSGKWELGIYHLPPLKPPPSPIIPKETYKKRKKTSLISPPLTPQISSCSPGALPNLSPVPTSAKGDSLDLPEWQFVPLRRALDNSFPRLAHSIPAYARAPARIYKLEDTGNVYDKDDKGSKGEPLCSNNKIKGHRRKQEEYLKQAAKMWQRGDKKSRGEIAFYYAEKVGFQILELRFADIITRHENSKN